MKLSKNIVELLTAHAYKSDKDLVERGRVLRLNLALKLNISEIGVRMAAGRNESDNVLTTKTAQNVFEEHGLTESEIFEPETAKA